MVDQEQAGVRRGPAWPMTVVFLSLVVALVVAFLLSSRATPAVSAVGQLVSAPDTPFTVIADPVTPGSPPFTVSTVVAPAASLALSLPGTVAPTQVLVALEAAGLDPLTARAVRSTLTSVNEDGSLSPYITISLITEDGYVDVAGLTPDGNALWYTPAVVQVPADLSAGKEWTSEGLTLDFAPFTMRGTVVGPAAGTEEVPGYGSPQGCLDLRTEMNQEIPEGEGYTTERLTTWCPGLGAIASTTLRDGVKTRLVTPDQVQWPVAGVPTPPESRPPGTRLAFPISVTAIARPPLSVPGGVVLVNGASADLALATVGPAEESGGAGSSTLTWLQHPGGTVLGTAVGEDRVYVTTSLRVLQSFDLAGRLRWSTALPDVAAGAPVPLGSVVAVASVDGSLRGFDVATGAPKWTVRLSDVITESPVRVGEKVVAVDTSGSLVAVDQSGAELSSTSLDSADSLSGLADGSVLVGQTSGEVTLVDANGEERWSVSFPDSGVVSEAKLWGDVIAVPTDGGLRGLSAADGSLLWTLADLPSASVTANGLVASAGRVLRVTADGRASLITDLQEADGSVPTHVFLTELGEQWVAVSQLGSITFLGVPRE